MDVDDPITEILVDSGRALKVNRQIRVKNHEHRG
jgi:hypothetical protein